MEESKELKAEPIALAVEPKTTPAVVVEPVAKVVEKKEAAAEVKADTVPGGKKLAGDGIFVQLSALKRNTHVKNSRSVTSVQTRLVELGYSEAGNDNRGTFGDSTFDALCDFYSDSKLKADSCIDEAVIVALFDGTAVEVVA